MGAISLKYKCLILDHDDTAVDSTAFIHYPAHVQVMQLLRPEQEPISLEGWFLKNFDPGIMEYLTHELGFDEAEIEKEYEVWRNFTTSKIPHFYPGFIEALIAYRERGGIVAVVSHSEKSLIERDYLSYTGTMPFMPDIIFGWDYDKKKRKPSLYPVREIMKTYTLKADEMLVVDDLKPGVVMARSARISVAAAGWSHCIAEIEQYMRDNCDVYLENVADFEAFILS
jgi:phosphoglycolate phosphatase/pyrophosphatase PpaX